MARIAALSTTEAFGTETPNAVTTKITIRRYLEGFAFEGMILPPEGQIAYHGSDCRRLDFCR